MGGRLGRRQWRQHQRTRLRLKPTQESNILARRAENNGHYMGLVAIDERHLLCSYSSEMCRSNSILDALITGPDIRSRAPRLMSLYTFPVNVPRVTAAASRLQSPLYPFLSRRGMWIR